uniref:Uncharacterized protein n=1 Tax=Candidatus Kentrum sp. LPFa TaxID=2126335 RepID=A0A450WDU0_9GAMM|nr:MAG: hypothetical protein BECKLPF1236B_GA0070989_107315 [Candidatus Kentron sp. LPFa]
MLNLILKTVSENWPWLVPLLLYVFYWLRYYFKKKPLHVGDYDNLVSDLIDLLGRDNAIAWIENRTRSWEYIRYQTSLDGLLARFDHWFGGFKEGWLNPRALHLCYMMAYAYPLLFVFFTWLVTGEGRLGELKLFSSIDEGWEQLWLGGLLIFATGFGSYIVFLFLSGKLTEWIRKQLPIDRSKRERWVIASIITVVITVFCAGVAAVVVAGTNIGVLFGALFGAFVCASAGSFAVSIRELRGVTAANRAIIIAAAIAIAGAVVGAGISAVAGAIAVVGIAAGASAIAVAIGIINADENPTSSVAVLGAVVVASAGVGAGVGIGAGIVAVIGAVIFYVTGQSQYVTTKKAEGNKVKFWLSMGYLLGMMFLALFVVSAFGQTEKLTNGMMGWIALGFLPVINALFDVVSLQLSRFLMGKIKQDNRYWNILWTIADVLAALLLLIGLYWAIFASLDAVDRLLFPDLQLFTVARWRELFWEQKDWFHPEILWLTLMASTTLIVTFIHLTFAFAHLFVPLWHRGDRKKIAEIIRAILEKAAAHPERKVPEANCRRLATAYYFPWEHGIVLGTLVLWGLGYVLYHVVLGG